MTAYAKHDASFFSQRAIFFIAIVILHIGLIYLFESGLATRIVKVIDPPIQTDIVQEQKKLDAPPPPPPPKMEHPPVEVPPPDVTINIPAAPNTTAITNVTDKPQPPAPPAPPPPRADVRTPVRLDLKHSPSTDDYYPPTSRRMNETGTTTVSVCAGPDGKLNADPKVEKSSGSSRLDEAAVRWATHVRVTPATLNGQPAAGCAAFNVVFKLTD